MSSPDRKEEVPSEKEFSYMDSNGYNAAAEAKNATAREHDMTVGQSIKLYYPAILWSILLSATVVMEGYDVNLMSNLFPMQSFSSKYGVKMENGIYEVTAPWKTGLANGALVGQIVGLWLSSIIAEKLGSRKTMIIFLVMMILAVFAPFFAPNVIVLTIGQVLCGLPWGAFQTLPAAYASEVCPTKLRAYLCTYVNLCWVFGQLIASGILRAMLGRTDEWSYKVPFALQWLWPVPILVGVFFAPESPWWLVRHGRKEEAKHAILRLTSRKSGIEFSADEQIAMIEQTNNAEMSIAEGTSYMDCFKGIDRRRTEVACITWLIQAVCGSNLMGWSTYFYAQAGLPQKMAYNMSLGQYAIGFFGTIGSWWMMSGVGRRKIYLYGLCGLLVVLLAVGGLACLPEGTSTKGWAIGSALLVFAGVYNSSVGPVCYALVAEVSSTRLKGKTIALARLSYNIGNIISTIITTYQLSPPGGEVNGWGWYAKSGFFWAGSCAICIIWCFFRLPEPKDRTYAEMDELFERKIPARKFSKTDVSVFDDVEATNENEEKGHVGNTVVKEVEIF